MHSRGRGFCHTEIAHHIHVENFGPVAIFRAEDRPVVRIGGRVVDENVHPAEFVAGCLHQRFYRVAVARMRGQSQSLPALGADSRGYAVQRVLLAAAQHNRRTRRRVGAGNRLANAPGCAGNNRDFPSQVKVGEVAHSGSWWVWESGYCA